MKKEEDILKFWKENKIFEKSVEQAKSRPYFSFYDGPPFLSGKPHYGHILTATIKDTVARYKTMNGYNVPRRVGWDCHGLPIENLVENELNIKNKKEIEEKIGIEKFNKTCRDSVFSSLNIFQKTLQRIGRWADYSDAYMTLDNAYIESVWWVLKQLWNKGLIYKDYRVSPFCPRCGTPLSNFEVNLGYKDASDPSILVKFKVKNEKLKVNEYFLVWTTTPWTLTANTALAVGKDIDYVKVKINNESFILAKERLNVINGECEILEKIKGKDLLGIEYEPIFEFIKPEKKAHFVISGDFVSIEDGSGIVHIAPAFGADDMDAGKKNNLPAIITVDKQGKMLSKNSPWNGKFVKDADTLIIEDLKKRNLLFKSEKIIHTYPFCWRCDSPLLYYPLETWYIAVEKIKDELIKNNKKINWVPEHIKEGRFGKWLEGARDWAFTRNRYWGAPLPVWKCQKCGDHIAVSSIEDLEKNSKKSGNKYFLLRHGESEKNIRGINSCWPEKELNHITKKGRKDIEEVAKKLKKEKIDFIFSSDLARAKQTAEIISKEIGILVGFDERLREYNTGVYNGRPCEDFGEFIGDDEMNKFIRTPENGENLNNIRKRMMNLILELENKYNNKNILIVSHGDPLWVLEGAMRGLDEKKIIEISKNYIQTSELREAELLNLPYSKDGKLDLHRPYIDEIILKCQKCESEMRRIEEVFDCWFESGAMPYAQYHYPFENKKLVEDTFPADFITEGLDQTRGWFYTLHVLATALTLKDIGLRENEPAFKNVVVNGLILDSTGRKLSKKFKNYAEPEEIMEKFGSDALRFYLLSSTAIGEDYLFADKGVQESMRKIVASFYNSLDFLKTYWKSDFKISKFGFGANILDKWILVRLEQTIIDVVKNMDAYDLTRASRVFIDFFDDLNNWYIRRSRARFQHPENEKDYQNAINVLHYVLLETSKLLAPFTPFVSEAVYQELKQFNPAELKESVHLENYPVSHRPSVISHQLLEEMEEARKIVSFALKARARAGIRVRQPLASLKIRNLKHEIRNDKELLNLIKEEVNVKEIIFSTQSAQSGSGWEVELDTKLTSELIQEGMARELLRHIQDLRKKSGLIPQDKINLVVQTSQEGEKLINSFANEIKKGTNTASIKFSIVPEAEELKTGEIIFKIKIDIPARGIA